MKQFKINEDRLIELLAAEMELDALTQGGVDNWEWAGVSCGDFISYLAREYNLPRKDLTFHDIAKHIVKIGDINLEEVI